MEFVFGFLMLVSVWRWLVSKNTDEESNRRRGRRLLTLEQARKRADALYGKETGRLYWGGADLSRALATLHWAVLGATGSGKTLCIRLLYQGLLKPPAGSPPVHGMIYDNKTDMLSLLAGMELEVPIYTLHPFDLRSAAWDIARDCKSPARAQQLATTIIPDEGGPNKFFSAAARDILTSLLIALTMSHPGRWKLSDLLRVARDRALLAKHLITVPPGYSCDSYFADEKVLGNILASLNTYLAPFAPIAACWKHATEWVAVEDWIYTPSVWVLGNDDRAKSAIDTINRMIVQVSSEMVLARPDDEYPRFIFGFDEIREAGKLPLSSLLLRGRSKGAVVVLGMQDFDGFVEVYGENVAHEMLGQCAHTAFLRLETDRSAERASKSIGREEIIQPQETVSKTGNSKSTSTTYQVVERDLVMASDLMNIPPTNRSNGLTGFYVAPSLGPYKATIDAATLDNRLAPPDEGVAEFIPRDPNHQF